MKDTIIVRCPSCGQWVAIKRKSFSDKANDSIMESAEKSYSYGADFVEGLGFGKTMQNIAGTFTSLIAGATNIPTAKMVLRGVFEDAFHGFCPKCNYELSFDDDSVDETEDYNKYIKEENNRENSPSVMLKKRFFDPDIIPENAKVIDDYIEDLKEVVATEEDAVLRSDLYDILSLMYWWKDDDSAAYDYVKKACDEPLENNDLSHKLLAYYIANTSFEVDNAQTHYKNLKTLNEYQSYDGYLLNKEAYANAFELSKQSYVHDFLSIPAKDRRFVVFSEKFDVFPESFYVLPLHMIPDELIIDGEFEENELYIRHPFRDNKYILAKNYAMSIFRDKAYEFKDIMVKLGAKEFFFIDKSERNSSSKTDKHVETGVKANVTVGKGSGGINGEFNTTENQQRKFFNEISEVTKYALTDEYPYVPNDVIWYPHDGRWQKEVENRLDGRTTEGDYTITLNESVSVSSKKQIKINADLKLLIGGSEANVGYESNVSKDLEMMHSWQCHVEFYPMEEYKKNKILKTIEPLSINFSNAEQEYLDELQECLADGNIGNSERRLLNKLRVKLNITEERAKDLESSLQETQLTEEEKEYLEAYKDAMEDGIVTEKERRLLDKLMKINNISEQRAKEIEKLYEK